MSLMIATPGRAGQAGVGLTRNRNLGPVALLCAQTMESSMSKSIAGGLMQVTDTYGWPMHAGQDRYPPRYSPGTTGETRRHRRLRDLPPSIARHNDAGAAVRREVHMDHGILPVLRGRRRTY